MTCYYPRSAYPIDGGISFEKPRGHSGRIVKIPCRKCTGCRLDHRSNWSTRMLHEASLYSDNQFVTLTYDPENLPARGDLDQTDMQRFFKRLRKHFASQTLRYVYSGEYGGKFSRPHYHAIIFGLRLPDLIREGSNERDEPLFGSAILDELWTHGHCVTGAVTEQSCAYVAAYMLKDINGEYDKRNVYTTVDVNTGELTERKRPFARYSNRPGIGKAWFDKYHADVFPHDYVVNKDGKQRAVPSYYFRLLEDLDPEMYAAVRAKRDAAIYDPKNRANSTPSRLQVREQVKLAKVNLKSRGTKSEGNRTIYIADDRND